MTKITSIEAIDVRYPTSRMLDGSDAMNPDPDYSAAYAVIHTSVDGLYGHGMTFTIGRGNELCVAAINALAPLVVGTTLEQLTADMAGLSRRLLGDSQLRWVGPEKGVVHLGAAAIINAVWDLWGKQAGKPVWQLVGDLEPETLLSTLDLRHITDAISHGEALDLLKDQARGKAQRRARLEREGYPAYTTSAGWLGYPDDKILRLTAEARAQGWTAIKVKVVRTMAQVAYQLAAVYWENLNKIEADPNTEWIIVDFNSDDGLFDFMMKALDLSSRRVFYAVDQSNRPWHCSYAKNVAHRAARGSILMSLDCDNLIGDVIPIIRDQFAQGCQVLHHFGPLCGSHGRVVIDRAAFHRLGGYDEQLYPMGHQDCDLMDRARAMGMKVVQVEPTESLAVPNTKVESIANCKNGRMTWGDFNRRNILISNHNIAAGRLVANRLKPWKPLNLMMYNGLR
jgi:hypothetical protein